MKSYPSIETIYVRDPETHRLRFGEVRLPEANVIRDWTFSEKIDGMNIRVIVNLAGIEFRGRTDAAQLRPDVIDAVNRNFDHARLLEYFSGYVGKELWPEWSVTFYGEAYGAGIQKGGVYSKDKRFRCFDLLFGGNLWADDDEMRKVCTDLNIPVVPIISHPFFEGQHLPRTRSELLDIIPESIVALEDSSASGVLPEGIVAKPRGTVLLDRRGNRVLWKLTFREFDKSGA